MSEERRKFVHEGRTIYEWQQSLNEVEIFVAPPGGVKASMLECEIGTEALKLGIRGNPPFIQERFPAKVKPSDSFWTLEDGELHITLQKMVKGSTWPSALAGHGEVRLRWPGTARALTPPPLATRSRKMNEVEATEDRKRIMLERFQEENPGFDFSNADFSGQVPDASTFLGGAKYDR